MTKQSPDIKSWINQNLWNMLITLVGIVVAFVTLQAQVIRISAAQIAMEEKIAKYPSEDWFKLKFETIEKKQDEIKQDVAELKKLK